MPDAPDAAATPVPSSSDASSRWGALWRTLRGLAPEQNTTASGDGEAASGTTPKTSEETSPGASPASALRHSTPAAGSGVNED